MDTKIIVYPDMFTYDTVISVVNSDNKILCTDKCTIETMNDIIIQYSNEYQSNYIVFACDNREFGKHFKTSLLTYAAERYANNNYTIEVI